MAGYRSTSSLEDLQLTRDEVDRIGNALKKEEFRKLLVDYVEEINDPENKKKYEEEITILEKERGFDITFVTPEPGYVIKTSVDGQKKAFINVCKSDKIDKPTSARAARSRSLGMEWSLPYSQAPPRDDLDASGNRCVVYDVVFHPETHRLAENNSHFRNMLSETALDAVENSFNVKLDRKNIRFPKMDYKGLAHSTVLRTKSSDAHAKVEEDFDFPGYPYNSYIETSPRKSETTVPKKAQERKVTTKESKCENENYTTPTYLIKHSSSVDVQDFTNDKSSKINAALPKELIIEINLPLLNSSDELILDVMEKSLSLQSEKPAKYKLHLTLPYTVDEDAGDAKFDKRLRKLTVTLPLKYRRDTFLADMGREDSGVESDMGCRTPESSSGDDDSIETENNNNPKIEDTALRTETSNSASDVYRTNSIRSGIQSAANDKMKIEVSKVSEEELVVEISPEQEVDSKEKENSAEREEEDRGNNNTLEEPQQNHPMLEKCRTWSESSGDEMGLSPTKKGILKYKGRVCRSLSESSVDDYIWPASLDMLVQSGGSDSCIPEEDEERAIKKTVRFNEVVSQKVYRSNSSILGQRKKNQRKMRNKKRAQERRASESETSEGEFDREREKGREIKTEDDEEQNNNNGSPEENGDAENGDEVFETQVSLQNEPRKWVTTKGKKKTRSKGGETVLKDQSKVPQLDFRNDLIFDLDM